MHFGAAQSKHHIPWNVFLFCLFFCCSSPASPTGRSVAVESSTPQSIHCTRLAAFDLVRVVGQLVQVLHLVEALGDAVGRQPRLRVVVPALVDAGAHRLDALQGAQWSTRQQAAFFGQYLM